MSAVLGRWPRRPRSLDVCLDGHTASIPHCSGLGYDGERQSISLGKQRIALWGARRRALPLSSCLWAVAEALRATPGATLGATLDATLGGSLGDVHTLSTRRHVFDHDGPERCARLA